jgi:hypothetical protein
MLKNVQTGTNRLCILSLERKKNLFKMLKRILQRSRNMATGDGQNKLVNSLRSRLLGALSKLSRSDPAVLFFQVKPGHTNQVRIRFSFP